MSFIILNKRFFVGDISSIDAWNASAIVLLSVFFDVNGKTKDFTVIVWTETQCICIRSVCVLSFTTVCKLNVLNIIVYCLKFDISANRHCRDSRRPKEEVENRFYWIKNEEHEQAYVQRIATTKLGITHERRAIFVRPWHFVYSVSDRST